MDLHASRLVEEAADEQAAAKLSTAADAAARPAFDQNL
jgi:hypothetical protein